MNNKLTITALAIAAVGIGLATSAPARASGNLMEKCQNNNSRYDVVKCCNTWIRQKGKPFWFGDAASCQSVVACVGKANVVGITAVAFKPKCQIVMPLPRGNGKSGGSDPTPPTVVGVVALARP